MVKKHNKFIKVYLTYSELCGYKMEQAKLTQYLSNFPLKGIFHVLSAMSFVGQNDQRIRLCFEGYINSLSSQFGLSFDSLLADRQFYTPQGTLTGWKWLLAYGDYNKLNTDLTWEDGINKAILLQLAVADYLYETTPEEYIIMEIIRNILFNSHDNLASMIGRTKKIFIDIAKNKELFYPSEYVDFNADFEKVYGYTIEDFLMAIFGLISLYITSDLGSFPQVNLKYAFRNTAYNELINNIIEPLCFSFDEGRTWSQQTLETPWDFRLFRQKPLLRLDDNTIIPLSSEFLANQVFNSLYWKIRSCYPKEDINFQRFFGRPFEIYIQQLLYNSAISSGLNYEFIPEFKYDQDQRSSPDVMLRLGDKLLAVECKAKGVTDLSAIDGKEDSIEKDYKRLVSDPYKQLIERLKELKAGNSSYDFSRITGYYLLTVNQKDFPHVMPYEERIINRINTENELPVKYYGHCDIEEIEMISYLISRSGKKSIFRILENHFKIERYQCIKNFIFKSSLPVRRPSYLTEASEHFMTKCRNTLFPKDKT